MSDEQNLTILKNKEKIAWKESLKERYIWDNSKRTKVPIVRVPEREQKERTQEVFKK